MELQQFAEEIRDFLSDQLTPELRHYGEAFAAHGIPRAVAEEWMRILDRQGWSVPAWPVAYGGTGWNIDQLAVFQRELTLGCAPRLMVQGVDYVGPVLIEFGTQAQKHALLPRIRQGIDWWAQGYSEPGAGSDLAALQCRAERDGDDFIVNGTKIWTTYAHECNKIFCLLRTRDGGKPQAGISFLMFDLDLPGIEIRPIVTFGGEHEFNQVFFNDVRVPGSALLGAENEGWTVSKFLLTGERAHSFGAFVHVYLNRTRSFVRDHQPDLNLDPDFRARLAALEADLVALDALEQTTFERLKRDPRGAAALSSVTKIRGTELEQRVTEFAVEVLGTYAIPDQPRLLKPDSLGQLVGPPTPHTAVAAGQYFGDRSITIAGGTTEVQKNVIATRVLGL